MSDVFYRAIRFIGTHIFWASSRPVVFGLEHIPREGPCLIASNHTSPYDVALLIRHVPRLLDFVSIVEVFRNPLLGWFYGSMNAFPLDRHKPDAPTVRTILSRLRRGRVVVMFPEGGFRRGEASVVHTRKMKSGIGRIVNMANIPIVPAVVINSSVYSKPVSWLPLFRARYALAFAPPIAPDLPPEQIESRIVESIVNLYTLASGKLPEHARVL
ncbi:MAG: 1-acyl-sn-glycerol-3-phosphate acyltransferase [Planctomycetes bacterium]|nr:1-acyl-sn-glycerol-3-phosphate acyltransferase [Planctomycetota bacterium]